ncbi:putative inactive leucine-rich repeat receptor-like protein kinase [Salvia divinorum]|uniref:Inactive leucine-rich repeat receptor-like protein kinase n=1 Tax=Salvia divinorum TaxID=28513 RepID=A0ABD1I0B2_SALDI
MAKARIFLFIFLFLVQPIFSNQLGNNSQFQTLLKIKQQLNFPQEIAVEDESEDFCNNEPTQILSLACYEGNITQLHITGNYWFPHLSQDFSAAALFSNIAELPNLKVLSLVALGLVGPLPSEIGGLVSLEILNVTSNMFGGSIPREMSFIKNLQTLILDHNRFEGEIPDWIGSLPSLRVLSVKNNSFSGSFPRAFSSMVNLRALVLTANNLSGEVAELHNLTNLQVLDLEDNNLGPQFPSIPKKIVSLVLRKNRFHSTVSLDEVSSWYQLQKLDISSNELVGAFSPSLLSLPSLAYLDIGGNKLTGKLLQNMSCNAGLTFVNLSENRLTGDLPDCLNGTSYGKRVVLYDGNCLSSTYMHQNPVLFCHSEALAVGISPRKKEKRPHGVAVLASTLVGAVVGTATLVGLTFLFVKRELAKRHMHPGKAPQTRLIVDKVSPGLTLQLLKDARYISETIKLGALGLSPYRTFVVDELKEATDNFNALHLIGEGSYGQVYKGWLTDGTAIAIRSLKVKRKHSNQTYTHQLELNSKLRHSHLVSTIGHCFECHQNDSSISRILLVSEYVPNGTLRKYISDGQSGHKFTWTQRIAAGIGVARGILFLHTGIVPGVYSNRLKITDVLLDHNLHVKIKKFNLPLFVDNKRSGQVEDRNCGSKPKSGSMSGGDEKHDVYDFGVILLEMIVGRVINSLNDITISKDILSVSLTADSMARRSIVDPAVHKECSDDSLRTLMELCLRCLSNELHERPSVEDAVWNLQFAAQVEDTWHRNSSSNRSSPCLNNAAEA